MRTEQHSEIGASSFWRAKMCPASVKEARKAPNTPNPDADLGTLMHKALETGDMEGLTDYQAKNVQDVETHRETTLERWPDRPRLKVEFEKKVYLRDKTGRFVSWGTLDYRVILGDKDGNPEGAYINDAKFGMSGAFDEEAFIYQGAFYGICTLQEYPSIKAVYIDAHNPFGPQTSDLLLKRKEDYKAWGEEFVEIKQEALGGDPPYNPGAACKYCDARVSCSHAAEYAEGALVKANDGTPVLRQDGDHFEILDEQRMAEQVKGLRHIQKLVKDRLDLYKRAAIDASERGEKLNCLELASGKKTRTILKREDAEYRIEPYLVPLRDLRCNTWSFPDLVRVVKERDKVSDAKARKIASELLGDCLGEKVGTPILRVKKGVAQ